MNPDDVSGSVAEPLQTHWRPLVQRRLLVLACIFAVWTVGIVARLTYLQVVSHEDMVARADRQQRRPVTLPAKRGEIFDRNGRLLAYSVDADTIYAVPSEVEDPARAASSLCRALDECAATYQAELAELDTEVAAIVASLPVDQRILVANHDSLEYFAHRYDFEVLGSVIPSSSSLAETNTADLDDLAEQLKQMQKLGGK